MKFWTNTQVIWELVNASILGLGATERAADEAYSYDRNWLIKQFVKTLSHLSNSQNNVIIKNKEKIL